MNRPGMMMKRLFVTLVALCLAGPASAQGVLPPVPDTSSTPSFRTPPGIKGLPKYYSEDVLWKAPSANKEKALNAYQSAMRRRAAFAPSQGVDCAMIIWADTMATAPMPTLTPAPNVDPHMPMLAPDRGCMPPASLKRLPDSLRTPQFPLKKHPMKFPRK